MKKFTFRLDRVLHLREAAERMQGTVLNRAVEAATARRLESEASALFRFETLELGVDVGQRVFADDRQLALGVAIVELGIRHGVLDYVSKRGTLGKRVGSVVKVVTRPR